jgi:hypothetical protein
LPAETTHRKRSDVDARRQTGNLLGIGRDVA